jgi:hypothetical protein
MTGHEPPRDPDATLRQLRELVGRVYRHWDGQDVLHSGQLEATALRMAELVDTLDEWLSRGGTPPADWTNQ